MPGTLAGKGSRVCRPYGETHHPNGDEGQGDRTGAGRHARKQAAERLGAGIGAVRNRVRAYREGGMAALRPKNRNAGQADRPAMRRDRSAGDAEAPRRRVEEPELGNALMREVAEAFASSRGRYGYRRIMAEDGLTAHVPERRGYGSYEGEATPAPGDLADRMLVRAAETLPEGARPLVHSDRGCHCRRPGWLALMDHYGPARSTGAKGRSPDDAAAEGFFGRMKTEPVYPGHWEERTRDGVLVLIDDCIRWHDHGRIKRSLGWMSPVQIPSKPGNGCVIISKKTSAAPP